MLQSLADTWWTWIVLGFALGVLEILVPGYIFLGFAIGAVLTGILVGTGLAPSGLAFLILVFAVLSVIAWLVLRRTMGIREGQVKIWDRDINDSR
jgi:membrane protein implicated in regulation of membrane protease activity